MHLGKCVIVNYKNLILTIIYAGKERKRVMTLNQLYPIGKNPEDLVVGIFA